MCRRTTCNNCGKPTYKGCGMHIEQVLSDVPRAHRCTCGSRLPHTNSTTFQSTKTGLLARLLRRH